MISTSDDILKDLDALMTGQWISDLSNFCSLFYHGLPEVSWIGFYLNDGKSLKLGPFQGKIACTEITYDRGVCGAAFSQQKTLIVEDVHQFPGHIACDSASNSEIVLPLTMPDGKRLGVLDVDSTKLARFTAEDQRLFEGALEVLLRHHPDLAVRLAKAY